MHRPDFHGHSHGLAIAFAVLLSILFVTSLVTLALTSSQHGLAIMLLPCTVLFLLLCLTVHRMNAELEKQSEQVCSWHKNR